MQTSFSWNNENVEFIIYFGQIAAIWQKKEK